MKAKDPMVPDQEEMRAYILNDLKHLKDLSEGSEGMMRVYYSGRMLSLTFVLTGFYGYTQEELDES